MRARHALHPNSAGSTPAYERHTGSTRPEYAPARGAVTAPGSTPGSVTESPGSVGAPAHERDTGEVPRGSAPRHGSAGSTPAPVSRNNTPGSVRLDKHN